MLDKNENITNIDTIAKTSNTLSKIKCQTKRI